MSDMHKKISQLLKAADQLSSKYEAETFIAKARALMEQHNIELRELGRLDEDEVAVERDAVILPKSYKWMRRVMSALSAYNGCRPIYDDSGSKLKVHVAGRQSARTTLKIVMPWIVRQVRVLGREAHAEGMYRNGASADTDIGTALAQRLYELYDSEKDRVDTTGAPVTGDTSTALVPLNDIQLAIDDAFGDAITKSVPKAVTYSGYARKMADRVNLDPNSDAIQAPNKLITKG